MLPQLSLVIPVIIVRNTGLVENDVVVRVVVGVGVDCFRKGCCECESFVDVVVVVLLLVVDNTTAGDTDDGNTNKSLGTFIQVPKCCNVILYSKGVSFHTKSVPELRVLATLLLFDGCCCCCWNDINGGITSHALW